MENRYREADFRTFWGFRVLGIDGSKGLLPDTEAVRAAFGTITDSNGKDTQIQGERPYALASVRYDVLNRVALEATLGRADADEVDWAIGHLAHTGPTDLLVMDRNDPSYRMLAELTPRQRHVVIRCSAAAFGAARRMRRGEGPDSQRVTLTRCAAPAPLIGQLGLPPALMVRFVRVRLSTGEWEVRVIALRDERGYPTAGFLELYHWRWGVELAIKRLKNILDVDRLRARQESRLADLSLHGTLLYAWVVETRARRRCGDNWNRLDHPRRTTPWRIWNLLHRELTSAITAAHQWTLRRWAEALDVLQERSPNQNENCWAETAALVSRNSIDYISASNIPAGIAQSVEQLIRN